MCQLKEIKFQLDITCATFSNVSLGEDMAYEHVHHNSAVVYCTLVGGKVHCGIPGFPLHPHHDRAAAQTHSYKDL